MVSTVVLGLFPPIPVAFNGPHQLQSYPRLNVHFSSSCRVFTRSVRLGRVGCGAGSHRGVRCLLLCRALVPFPGITEHRQPEPRPLAPEVARVVSGSPCIFSPAGCPGRPGFPFGLPLRLNVVIVVALFVPRVLPLSHARGVRESRKSQPT